MFLQAILTWMWKNRSVIAIALLICAIYAVGDYRGRAAVHSQWDAAKTKQKEEAMLAQSILQAQSDALDEAHAKELDALTKTVGTLQRRLSHATSDAAYRCKPTPDGVRSLNAIIGAAGQAASQRHD